MKRRIVIACDSFKGCLGSGEVASAVAEGIRQAMHETETAMMKVTEDNNIEIIEMKVADGGEGTSEILTRILGGEKIEAIVSDPLGRPVKATYGIVSQEDKTKIIPEDKSADRTGNRQAGRTAVIEMAQACGLTLLAKDECDPLTTSTFGVGEMILDAVSRGCRRFLIGIGGSATNDGGTGMLEALGFRFTDKDGNAIEGCCGDRLSEIADIDSTDVPKEILESEFIIACDVNTPFSGGEGASMVFARQKGADDEAIERLENGMQSFARIINQKYKTVLNEIPGTGAAGGLGGAFKAFLNAELKSGIDMILDAAEFNRIIEGASLVITGEGRIDFQSGKGKVIYGICRRCRAKGIPVLAIAGIVDNLCIADETSQAYDYSCERSNHSNENKHGFLTVMPIGPRPKNESDLEHAMRPEVARKNISDTVARNLKDILAERQ